MVYLFFALSFWPMWFPIAALIIETSARRRILLALCVFLSTGRFWVIYLPAVMAPTQEAAHVFRHSIRYALPTLQRLDPAVQWFLRILYLTTSTVPLLTTHARRVMLIPVVLGGASSTFTVYLFDYAFISVWCFFAAAVSISFIYSIEIAPRKLPPEMLRFPGGAWFGPNAPT